MTAPTATLPVPTSPADPVPRPVSMLTSSLAFTGRSLRHSLRDGEGIAMAIVLPITLMLMFTYIFGGAILGVDGYLRFVLPGVIVLCASQGAASVAAGVSRDLGNGVMNRFRTMPILSATALVGHLVAGVLRDLIGAVTVLVVAVALGYRSAGGPWSLLAAAGFSLLFIVTIVAIMTAIGLVSGSPENAAGYGFIFFVLPYVSSGFAPLDTMPGWLRVFAANQPYSLVIETIRGFLDGTAVATGTWVGALAWCLGLLLVCAVVSAVVFPRRISR